VSHGGSLNEGNKSKGVMIGFGRGASDVQAHVTVLMITENGRIVLEEFNLDSKSGKKPCAAATMGVGSAAACLAAGSVGDEKETVEGDGSRIGKAVAKQIEDAMTAQQWIAAPQAQPQQNAGRSLPASVATMVAHPSRTKSLRLMRSLSGPRVPPCRRASQ
jgi:hypothetical protein